MYIKGFLFPTWEEWRSLRPWTRLRWWIFFMVVITDFREFWVQLYVAVS